MSRVGTRVGVFAALFIFVISIAVPAAGAAASTDPNGGFNVVITPSSKDLAVKPGGSVTETMQLKNQGIATEHIKVSVMKFSSDNQSGLPVLAKPGASDTFVNWAKISTPDFYAEPGVWAPVQVTINPPKTAAFGYYYAIVFSRAQEQSQSKVANLLGSVASLILLDVQAPGEVRAVNVAGFSTDKSVYEFLPVTFTVTMHNSGNVHVVSRGNIDITKGGKNVALLEVNLAEGNILPDSSRKFTSQWTDGAPSYQPKKSNGNYDVNKSGRTATSLDWSNLSLGKLRFGEYNAKLIMVYNDGEGDVAKQATLNFWVVPWRILAVLLVILILVLGGLWMLLVKPLRRRFGRGQRGNVRFR